MKTLFLTLSLSLSLAAQTAVSPFNLRSQADEAATGVLFVSGNSFFHLTPGPGLTVDLVTKTISVIPAAPKPLQSQSWTVTAAEQTVFTLSNTPAPGFLVFRNGLYMTLSKDYTFSGSTITFVPAQKPRITDIVTVVYQ